MFESRRGSPACITPKGNCATSPVDAPNAIQPTTDRATGGTRCCTTRPTEVYLECSNQYGLTAPLRGPRGATPETRPPVLPVGRRPRTKLSGDFNSSLVFLRRVTPLYNLVVGGPVRGPHGGTHPKAVSRGQTHPASGPFLPRHAALKARPLEQSGPHTGTLTHRVNTTGYPW